MRRVDETPRLPCPHVLLGTPPTLEPVSGGAARDSTAVYPGAAVALRRFARPSVSSAWRSSTDN